jgi:hypothetical protein
LLCCSVPIDAVAGALSFCGTLTLTFFHDYRACWNVLELFIMDDDDAYTRAATRACALEALLEHEPRERHESDEFTQESFRVLLDLLRYDAQLHDEARCEHAACKRCAGLRARGAMCTHAGCGARTRADASADANAKTALRRCARCRTAAYCCVEHQREDWGRHKGECRAMRDAKSLSGGAAGGDAAAASDA